MFNDRDGSQIEQYRVHSRCSSNFFGAVYNRSMASMFIYAPGRSAKEYNITGAKNDQVERARTREGACIASMLLVVHP